MLTMLQRVAPNLQLFLDRLISRSVLSAAEQEAILGLPTRAFQTGRNQDFVRLGERVDHACFIVAGIVGHFDQAADGKRAITALHIPGDMPDLMSVVQPKATSALQALSATTILQVPHSALRSVAATYPALAEAFWRDCMVDAMIMAQWVVNLGRRDARTRLAHLLCEMGRRFDRNARSGKVTFTFAITQEQLADATGLTPVHVNRSLMSLKADGVLFRQGRVFIDDWAALEHIGDFDPGYLQDDLPPNELITITSR
jgi:CRP-like cAMP-binding protein